MLCSKLAACILLFVFIHSVESTNFHYKGKFICPNHDGRSTWCVSQQMVEADEFPDDIIIEWTKNCTSEKEVFIELDGSEDGDGGMPDQYMEPEVYFTSTCDPSQTKHYFLRFKQVHIDTPDVTLSYEISLPRRIIKKSP